MGLRKSRVAAAVMRMGVGSGPGLIALRSGRRAPSRVDHSSRKTVEAQPRRVTREREPTTNPRRCPHVLGAHLDAGALECGEERAQWGVRPADVAITRMLGLDPEARTHRFPTGPNRVARTPMRLSEWVSERVALRLPPTFQRKYALTRISHQGNGIGLPCVS
jgi:hypothetical protein